MTAPAPVSTEVNSHPIAATRWWVIALVSVTLFAACYVLAVLTPWGQTFENAALRGADQLSRADERDANDALDTITVWSLGVATLFVALIGLLRRKPLLAAIAVGVIVGGQLVTQSLKRFLLPRPELVPVTGDFTDNSFPSGHTTIAMTALIAVFLVTPYRFRGLATFFAGSWAVGIGAYTISAKWHRLSDTIGADLVTLTLGCLAALLLLRTGHIRRTSTRHRARTLVVIAFSLVAVAAAGAGVILASAAATQSLSSSIGEWNAYLAAHSLALAASLAVMLTYWATWHRLEAP